MKQNKKTVPAELSYYGLYLLDYLRKYHPDKVSDTYLIAEREEAAATTFEKERSAGSTVEYAHEEAMRVLLHGLHFSPYALLREVVENEFADEVAEILPVLAERPELVCGVMYIGGRLRPTVM